MPISPTSRCRPSGIEPKTPRTPIKHLVVVMMENRSVDHYLGWYGKENKAFDGTQTHSYVDRRPGQGNEVVHTENWGAGGRNDLNARFFNDPDHGWDGGRYQRNGGKMDQWLGPGTSNDEFALSTYNAGDLPLWAQLTRGWQTYDRWFCALLGPTQPNRYYLYSGQSAGLKDNTLPPELASRNPTWLTGFDWPTVWDLCSNGGVSTSYFFSNLPETAFWGYRQLHRTHHVAEYFAQCELGTLPQLSIIDPWFTGPSGIANDDHPLADIRLGQQFLSDVTEAFVTSPHYHEGALVITYDEWGGFWDHVAPPRVTDDRGTEQGPGRQGRLRPARLPHPVHDHLARGPGTTRSTTPSTTTPRSCGSCPRTGGCRTSRSGCGTRTASRAPSGASPPSTRTTTWCPTGSAPDAQLQMVLDATVDQLKQGHVPTLIPSKAPAAPPMSDLHRLAETGWFDHLDVNIDHRFEDGFLRPSDILEALSARPEA